MSLGLCLSGGGVKGAAHIGVIKALEENDVKIDYIGGTSSGSIVAALYASGFSSDEIYDIFKKYCKNIKYVDFFNIIKLVLGLIFTGKIVIDGLNSGKSVLSVVFEAENDVTCCDNFIDVAGRSISLLCKELSKYEMEGNDITMYLRTPKIGLLDMSKIDELYNIGYEEMRKNIYKIKNMID